MGDKMARARRIVIVTLVLLFVAVSCAATIRFGLMSMGMMLSTAAALMFCAGAYLVTVNGILPSAFPVRAVSPIDVDALLDAGVSQSLVDTLTALSSIEGEIEEMSDTYADAPDILRYVERLSRLVRAMSELAEDARFSKTISEDQQLMTSLVTLWLPDITSELRNNAEFADKGGIMTTRKATRNLDIIDEQVATVSDVIDKMRSNLLDTSENKVEIAGEYLRQRLDGSSDTIGEEIEPSTDAVADKPDNHRKRSF